MAKRNYHKEIVGRGELIDFVDCGLTNIPAKVDTGAFSSALNADQITLSDDGSTLTFRLLGDHPVAEGKTYIVSTKKFSRVWVSSSFGHREERYHVQLQVRVGTQTFWADFSLANRMKKAYPVLLGRKLLTDRFIVDTAQSQIDPSELRAKYGLDFFME